MTEKERFNLTLNIWYSYFYEKTTETLFSRMDKFFTFTSLILGSAAFANIIPANLVGVIVVFIASIQLVYKPADIATTAKLKKHQYLSLAKSLNKLNDDEILHRKQALEADESSEIAAIEQIADNRAMIKCGIPEQCEPLSWFVRLVGHVAGAYPFE